MTRAEQIATSHRWMAVGPNAAELWNVCRDCRANEGSAAAARPCPTTALDAAQEDERGGAEVAAHPGIVQEPEGRIMGVEHGPWATLGAKWEGTRDGVLGPGLRFAADDLHAALADSAGALAKVKADTWDECVRAVAGVSPDAIHNPYREGVGS